MHTDESQYQTPGDLAGRVAVLEAALCRMQRRQRRLRTLAATATVTTLTCLTLWAQNATGPITVRAPFRIIGASGQTIFSVTDAGSGAGKLEMKGSSGKSFTAGVTAQGDAYGRWDAANGSALIGVPPGKKDFGVRLLAAGTNTTTVAMAENSQSAMVAVGRNGTAKINLVVDSKSAAMGVLNDSGQSYLADFIDNGTGADLEMANKAGQIVAELGANPKNSEGHAVFTDAGGQPLAKIGAAGDHGDVVLSNSTRAIGLWEMALTGMLH